jgi:hypothetical protein
MPGVGLLRALDSWHAFDPVALPGFRSFGYVPFDELVGGTHEARLRTEIGNTQRTALIGPIGSGKSSFIETVLSEGKDDLAPIWLEAAHQDETVLSDPPEFARHLIRAVIGWARDAGAMDEDARRSFLLETSATHPNRMRRSRQTSSFKLALKWLEPAWSREVEETLADPEVERNRGDFIASLDRLVDLIVGDLGRTPVVVIDDSDRWLRLEPVRRDPLLTSFFTDTCRMLAERNWALVMAIHPEYTTTAAFRSAAANGYFNVQLGVPFLTDPGAIRAIVDRRIQDVSVALEKAALLEAGIALEMIDDVRAATADDVFGEGFAEVLLECYNATEGNLRAVLTVTQQAVQEAIGLAEPRVSAEGLREATLALAT